MVATFGLWAGEAKKLLCTERMGKIKSRLVESSREEGECSSKKTERIEEAQTLICSVPGS